MADVFTKAKRSDVMSRIPGRGSEFPEVELIAGDAEVFDNVRNDTARHIARMPREGDEPVGTKRIGVMPVTASGTKKLTTDFTKSPLQLAAIPRGVFAHRSGGENKFVAESHGDRAARFEQCFQMSLGGLLKAEGGFAPVAPVRVAAGQERRFGNPNAVLVLTDLHFREWNDHSAATIARRTSGVKGAFDA
jgi:hypothetical protein